MGISGGGDSNALIMAFLASGLIQKEQLIAVMMLGIPDWDKGRARAEQICKEHEIKLRFVEAKEVNTLLGRKCNSDWVNDFEKIFPDADLEVLGTLAIRLSLKYVAQLVSAQAVVTGLNLEDLLAECILTTTQGKLPPPFPVRKIDDLDFWYPLYSVPKKIIDGCYPKFSLENYQDRYPSYMVARAIPYYVSQSLHGLLPGIEFDLIKGFKKLSKLNQNYIYVDDELGFSVLEPLSQTLREKWKKFTGDQNAPS